MTQIDDPTIFLLMGFHDLACSITTGIIHHDDVVNEARDHFKDFPNQFFFIVGRNEYSDGLIQVLISSGNRFRAGTVKGGVFCTHWISYRYKGVK